MSGKHVVITGGSRGIGMMIARGFVRAGAHVLISARKADQLAAAAEELSADGSVETVVADVSSRAGAEALAAEVLAWSPDRRRAGEQRRGDVGCVRSTTSPRTGSTRSSTPT